MKTRIVGIAVLASVVAFGLWLANGKAQEASLEPAVAPPIPLAAQLQAKEAQAADEAAKLRHQPGRANQPHSADQDESPNTQPNDESIVAVDQSKLLELLNEAFDLKLRLEEFRIRELERRLKALEQREQGDKLDEVRELQAQLSRVIRQLEKRQEQRKQIVARRAKELLDEPAPKASAPTDKSDELTLFLERLRSEQTGPFRGLPFAVNGGGQVIELYLREFKLRPGDARIIGRLTNLVRINLQGSNVSDNDLREFASLKNLQVLNLWHTQIGDEGVAAISGLSQLRSLFVGDTKISDAALPHVAKLTELRQLALARTRVTDAGLKPLLDLKKLIGLKLSETQISDTGLKILEGLAPTLRGITLDETNITAEGLANFAQREGFHWMKSAESVAHQLALLVSAGDADKVEAMLGIGVDLPSKGQFETLSVSPHLVTENDMARSRCRYRVEWNWNHDNRLDVLVAELSIRQGSARVIEVGILEPGIAGKKALEGNGKLDAHGQKVGNVVPPAAKTATSPAVNRNPVGAASGQPGERAPDPRGAIIECTVTVRLPMSKENELVYVRGVVVSADGLAVIPLSAKSIVADHRITAKTIVENQGGPNSGQSLMFLGSVVDSDEAHGLSLLKLDETVIGDARSKLFSVNWAKCRTSLPIKGERVTLRTRSELPRQAYIAATGLTYEKPLEGNDGFTLNSPGGVPIGTPIMSEDDELLGIVFEQAAFFNPSDPPGQQRNTNVPAVHVQKLLDKYPQVTKQRELPATIPAPAGATIADPNAKPVADDENPSKYAFPYHLPGSRIVIDEGLVDEVNRLASKKEQLQFLIRTLPPKDQVQTLLDDRQLYAIRLLSLTDCDEVMAPLMERFDVKHRGDGWPVVHAMARLGNRSVKPLLERLQQVANDRQKVAACGASLIELKGKKFPKFIDELKKRKDLKLPDNVLNDILEQYQLAPDD